MVHHDLSVQLCLFMRLGPDELVVQVLVDADISGKGHDFYFLYYHCKGLRGCG